MLTTIALVALMSGQVQPPQSPVTYDTPAHSEVTASYQCPEAVVALDYETRSWLSREHGFVKVTRFALGDQEADANTLKEWNLVLSAIRNFTSIEFLCQMRGRSFVYFRGGDETGEAVFVEANLVGVSGLFSKRR